MPPIEPLLRPPEVGPTVIAARLAGRDALAAEHVDAVGADVRKGHGQVMTPSDVAAFMADRLQSGPGQTVLEPGAGLGVLAHAALEVGRSKPSKLTLVELEAGCFTRLKGDTTFAGAELVNGDFIDFAIAAMRQGRKWERIIANPPYLNFHDFDREAVSKVCQATGTKMTKFSNLFSLFILLCTRLLAPGGRMVFITPTELFTTNYGKKALQQVAPGVRLSNVVVFEADAEPFENAMTTACITTFEATEGHNVRVERVHKRSHETRSWETVLEQELPLAAVLDDPKRIVNAHATRGHAVLDGTCTLGELFRVSRGIATGANNFFTFSGDDRANLDADGRYTVPVVAKAEDLGDGIAFDGKRLAQVEAAGRRCWLLYLDGHEQDLSSPVKQYLEKGEQDGVHERYLCKARNPWFSMEGQEPPLAFVGVFGREGVRVCLNAVGARTLATCHRLYAHKSAKLGEDELLLTVCFLRSALGREAMAAQFRRYGGGLQKLEPKDLERVLVPDVRRLPRQTLSDLAGEVRRAMGKERPPAEICASASDALVRAVSGSSGKPPQGQTRLPGLASTSR